MLLTTLFKKLTTLVTIALLAIGASFVHVELVLAASLTSLSNTQSSVQQSTLSDHTIQFVTPTGLTAGQTITITFPAGYTMGTFNVNNLDLATSTSATCSGFSDAQLQAGAASALTWGTSQSSQTITLTSGTAVIPANRCIQIQIGSNATFGATGVSQITNPGTPGTYEITIAGTFGDTGSISTYIVPDDTVSMTGTVQQSLTFTISTTTIYFGNLSSGGAKFASSTNTAGDSAETIAHTLAISTNAPFGFAITVRGDTLTSQQNSLNTITAIGAVAASSTPGTEQFAIRATESGGTGVTVDDTYRFSTSYGFDASSSTPSLFATGSGVTNTSTLSLRYLANVAGITEAGIYAANLTYVATANF
ncbi:MAG: hypothetical protein RI935_152 [Candidatus Parcubacteria bacterium]|jgi:hypothetical protein